MKKARICSIAAATDAGYVWRWQDCSNLAVSASTYDMYFECVEDARKHGYSVELTYASGQNAPGGEAFRLQDDTRLAE
jgi:hypothetical protein